MKKLALVSAIVLGGLFTETASAQIGISVGFHLGGRRVIAPIAQVSVQDAPDYYAADDYYYLPDIGAYYSVAEQCYYYNDGYNWVSATYLPGYRDYDWRNARRFEVHARRPYLNDNFYRSRYDGHINNWNHADNRVYADRDFNRGGYRADEYRNDNRGRDNERDHIQDDRFNRDRGFNQPQINRQPDNFGDRDRGNFNQPIQPNRNDGQRPNENHQNGNGGFNQPAQPNMNQQSYGGGRQNGNGGSVQSAQPNMNQGQPQNGGGRNGGQQAPANNGQGNQPQPSNNHGNGGFRGEQHITDNQMHGNGVTRFGRS